MTRLPPAQHQLGGEGEVGGSGGSAGLFVLFLVRVLVNLGKKSTNLLSCYVSGRKHEAHLDILLCHHITPASLGVE